jgi:hypothetical protein
MFKRNRQTTRLHFRIQIRELYLPSSDNSRTDSNQRQLVAQSLRAIAWYRGNKNSGVTKTVEGYATNDNGVRMEKHSFANGDDGEFAFVSTIERGKAKMLRLIVLEANKGLDQVAPKEGVKRVAGNHVGTVDVDLCDFMNSGDIGKEVALKVNLEGKLERGEAQRGGGKLSKARIVLVIKHDGFIEAEEKLAENEDDMVSATSTLISADVKQQQQQQQHREVMKGKKFDNDDDDADIRPISTFSVADVIKPGQRPVGNVSANHMLLAQPSASLHASRFGAGGAMNNTPRAAMSAVDPESFAMFTAERTRQQKQQETSKKEENNTNKNEEQENNNKNEEEEEWNPFAERGRSGSHGKNSNKEYDTPRFGSIDGISNNNTDAVVDNNNKTFDSDGFLLDSDLETEDEDDVFEDASDTENDGIGSLNGNQSEKEEEEFDDDDALTHRNDELYDDDRCTTPPLTPGPSRPPPTPPHRKSSYGGSSIGHRSELRDRDSDAAVLNSGFGNAAGGPMFVDKSPEFSKRRSKFRTDKQLFSNDVLESKSSPPSRKQRSNNDSLLVDVSFESDGDGMRATSFNDSMDRSTGDFDWSSIVMPRAAAASLLVRAQDNDGGGGGFPKPPSSDAPSLGNSELSMVERVSQDWDLEYRARIRPNSSDGPRSIRTNDSQKSNGGKELEQEIKNIKARYEKEVTDLKDDVSEEQLKNRRLTEELTKTRVNLDETATRLGAMQMSHSRLEEENEKLTNLVHSLKMDEETFKKKTNANESALTTKYAEIIANLSAETARADAAQNNLKVISLEKESAHSEIGQLSQLIETLRNDLNAERAKTSLEFAMRRSSLGDDHSDVIMGEARGFSSTSGNDSDGDLIPPWQKKNTAATKSKRMRQTRAIVDAHSTDDDDDDDESEDESEDGSGFESSKVGNIPLIHALTITEAALLRTPQTTETFDVAKVLFAYASGGTTDNECEERHYRVIDAFNGCVRGYAFEEPKQLVAIWVQIAAFARGVKSKGKTTNVWEDAKKLRDQTFTFAFEAVWRRAIYPSIICGDDDYAVEPLEKRNQINGDGERCGRYYVRALDRAAILLGVNETANQAPGLAIANAAILRAILARLDAALVRTVLSLDNDNSTTTFSKTAASLCDNRATAIFFNTLEDRIEDVSNIVPGKGVVSFSAGAQLKQCVTLITRWTESIGGIAKNDSGTSSSTSFIALPISRSLADAMMIPRENLIEDSVRKEIQGDLTDIMIAKILEKRVKCELDDDCVSPEIASAIARFITTLEQNSVGERTPPLNEASSFLDFNADKIAADQNWKQHESFHKERALVFSNAKRSSLAQFSARFELRERVEEEDDEAEHEED